MGNKDEVLSGYIYAARWDILSAGIIFPFLRCLDDEETDYVLREIHDAICGNHFGARTSAFKVLSRGISG